ELRGDGVSMPYTWAWIPNPPMAPPAATPTSVPAAPTAPPAVEQGSARRPSPPRAGHLYRWIDEQGAVHWTDRLDAVPEQYRSREPDQGSGEHLVGLRVDVDVAHAEPPRPGIDQVPEWNRNKRLALYRRHRFRATLDQESSRPVAETPAVMDIEAARRGAAKLVTDVFGDDAARDLARPQARGDALLEQARELELRQADVPVGIALDVSQRIGIQSLDQPFGKQGDAVLLAPGASLDDRPLENVGDLIEGERALGKLLPDDGQRRAGRAADAEGPVPGMPAHARHE